MVRDVFQEVEKVLDNYFYTSYHVSCSISEEVWSPDYSSVSFTVNFWNDQGEGYEWDEKIMKLVNSTLKEKEEIDSGFTQMMVDDKVKEDIKYVLANSDLSKVSTPFSDMLDWMEKKDRYMKCLQLANKKIGELVEENYWKSEEDKKMIEGIISDLQELRNNETNEELISDYNRKIEWLKEKI
jgi:hypothetical protein